MADDALFFEPRKVIATTALVSTSEEVLKRGGSCGRGRRYFVCPGFHRRLPISVTVFISSESGGCFDFTLSFRRRSPAATAFSLISFCPACSVSIATTSSATECLVATYATFDARPVGGPLFFRRFIVCSLGRMSSTVKVREARQARHQPMLGRTKRRKGNVRT